MITLISPAKSIDFESKLPTDQFSAPALLENAAYLAAKAKKLSARQLGKLMSISQDLSNLNEQRFGQWSEAHTVENARPALFAFNGDVYQGLAAYSLSKKEIKFAQQHLRILSGLYGLLSPLDLIQPYRLEMGTSMKITPKKTNLYQYWESTIADLLKSEMDDNTIVNLASNEYFKSVGKYLKDNQVITPIFKELKNGEYKVISFLAKKARGEMSRYIIENQINKPEHIKLFNKSNYSFSEPMSTATEWTFIR